MTSQPTPQTTRAPRDQRFVICGEAWDAFDQMLDEPVPYEDDLRDLLRTPTVFVQP